MVPVSPKLTFVRYINTVGWLLVLAAIGVAVMVFSDQSFTTWWVQLIAAGFVALVVWQLWLIPRQVKNTAWFEEEDELLITKGKLWHTFTVVPYGRIQFVDVSAGPVLRAFGLKTVELHTASATSDSTIPGLEAAQADALRDRLAMKARERMSGL
ncbi:PH domain-containing protein [Corynebacterium aquilae]|uniref:Membrane protein n=1 Tax=Corynebacterium aquilae DSM 44791 TaxID=1431546 RepID=A0A1L7CE16_9CORY|nr:PH domain-containing protein [Corynebacterium aquilae]APT84112.1 membrane protein [Corynebacterium aquilae DSM 44791]